MVWIPQKQIWTRQPPYPRPIDWGNPATRGLGVCLLPQCGPRNIVSNIAGVNQKSVIGGEHGFKASLAIATDCADIPIQFADATRAFTWLVVAKFASPSASWQGIFSAKRSGSKVLAMMRYLSGTPFLEVSTYDGSYHGATLDLPGFSSPVEVQNAGFGVFCLSVDATAGTGAGDTIVRQYTPASEVVTTTTLSAAGTFNFDASGSFFRAGGNHDGAYGSPSYAPWPHSLYLTLFWPSIAVDPAIVRDLRKNPWQIFAP